MGVFMIVALFFSPLPMYDDLKLSVSSTSYVNFIQLNTDGGFTPGAA
jgi:hypothetical protein